MKRTLSLLPLVLAAAGCASLSAEAAASRDQMSVADNRQVFGDVERMQFAKEMQVELPARCAITMSADDVAWGTLVTDALEKDTGTWTAVEPLRPFGEDGATHTNLLEPMRASAARQRADLLLVAQMNLADREHQNGWAWTKIFILPIFFVNTEEHELTFTTRTAVIDVRNGLVYATTEDHRKTELSATYAGENAAVRDARNTMAAASADALREKLERKLKALAQGR